MNDLQSYRAQCAAFGMASLADSLEFHTCQTPEQHAGGVAIKGCMRELERSIVEIFKSGQSIAHSDRKTKEE